MKKVCFLIAILAVVIFTSSALNEEQFGSQPGSIAAPIALSDNDTSVRLADMRGSYVLLSFWQSDDAASRQMCNTYDSWLREHNDASCGASNQKILMLGINFDNSPALFKMIVDNDKLDANSQFNVSGQRADQIRKDYHLGDALGTLLISPDGHVLKVNPSLNDLASL